MAANTATLLPDFPISIGNRRLSVITLTGPSSYTQVTQGSTPTGGQALAASQFGLKYIDSISVELDATGALTGLWTPASATNNGVSAGILCWMLIDTTDSRRLQEVTGTTDLSGKTLRVTAIGR